MLEHSIARSSILWHARDNSDALKFYTSANPCKHTYAYIKVLQIYPDGHQ